MLKQINDCNLKLSSDSASVLIPEHKRARKFHTTSNPRHKTNIPIQTTTREFKMSTQGIQPLKVHSILDPLLCT